MTNPTPAQLDEVDNGKARANQEHFPRLRLRSGRNDHAKPARDALGTAYPDEVMVIDYDQLLQDYGAITFEAFINLLVRHMALC
ncbi:hypothetical protein FOMPIDRAFT_1053585 [Fomitopsis schrenkii]|uniref:Uncharacterized protein n=1 Tax=Fomitopsis schrenkii TaxID=2126942 RepID=S8FC72_FOMSC|nr:hypothetical protein FOMPIDRAFT_1053585 [Fomitopsis schrenkii]